MAIMSRQIAGGLLQKSKPIINDQKVKQVNYTGERKVKTEWQEYGTACPPNNTIHIEAILSINKPSKDAIGILVDNGFSFRENDDNKLWVRFWVLDSEVEE